MSKKTFTLVSDFKVKAQDNTSSITIEGYANTTSKDRVGDVVLEEAWTKGGLSNYHKNPIILAYHNRSKPIGSATTLSVDSNGLKVVAEISKAAGDIYELIKEGVLKTFSVGFRVKDADYDSKTDIFVVKDLELYEISVVSIPANADSTFSVKKAFEDNQTEFEDFKKEFENNEEVEQASETNQDSDDIVKTIMDSLEKKLKTSEEKILNEIKESKAMPDKKVEDKEKKVEDKVDNTPIITSSDNNIEKLIAAFEKGLAEKDNNVSEALEGLRDQIKEKSAEIEALTKSRMEFEEREAASKVTKEDQDSAVLIAKLMGKPVAETDFTKQLITKAGAHLTGMTADWENEFSKRVENDIRQRLILEPLFRKVKMNAASMNIPVNPDAGTGVWIPTGDFGAASSSGTAAQTHGLTDTLLTAHKLAAKEFIGYEEEEDAIIPLVPIIRDAIVRRVARTTDIALLRGTGTAAAQPNHDPIAGLAKVAATAGGAQVTTKSIGGGGAVTAANLATVRRGLGTWGLTPSDVVYIVSEDVYYDLLDDPDFRTVDMVGDKATILKGQIGFINGSRVVVSGEFEAKAATKTAAVAVNASNFILGELRGILMEREKQIVEQQNVIVTTRRLAFLDVITGKGVSVLNWAA